MTAKEFIADIHEYYGTQYRKGKQRNMIYTYLSKKSSKYLDSLFEVTVKRFSGQYKTLPDIAIFEELTDEVYEDIQARRLEIQQDLSRKAIAADTEPVVSPEEARKFLDDLFKRLKSRCQKGIIA